MSNTLSNKSTQAAILLMCLSATSEAFTTGRPALSLATTTNQRNSIPVRAPVDVFYVDDESPEAAAVLSTPIAMSDQPEASLLESFTLNKELEIESLVDSDSDSDSREDDALFVLEAAGLAGEKLLQKHQLSSPAEDATASTSTITTDSVMAQELANELQPLKEEHDEELLRHEQQLSTMDIEPALSEKDIPAQPTFRDYRKFALPCFALLLSGPLLSLVDTVFVGLASTNAVELAALGPAAALFDSLTWFLSFLNIATTNLYSSALAKGDQAKGEGVVRTGSRVGLAVGLAVMGCLVGFAKPILTAYMGAQAAATPGLLAGASTYLTIRAFSMPTFLLLGVLQSALLGAKDGVTPLIAIGYSTIVNLLGDYFLVNVMGMGLKGAAIATTAAQWAATLALILPARKKLMANGKLGLANFKRKSSVSAKKFLSFSAPVILLLAGKLSVFTFLAQAAARVPGQPIPLASHQLIFSLFLFLCPFVEVINQTGQAFLPAFVSPVKDYVEKMQERNPGYNAKEDAVVQKWKGASRKVSVNLMKACLVLGAFAATFGSFIPKSFGQTLTGDIALQQAIKPLAKYLWWSTFLMGPMSATEGILLAKNKSWFLAIMYVFSTAAFPFVLFNFGSGSIGAVWACFSLFQAYRASIQTLKATEVSPRKILRKARNFISAPFHPQGAVA